MALDASPVVELNRAIAIAMRDGPAAALPILNRLVDHHDLARSHRVWAVRAELHSIIRDFPSLPVQPVLLCGQSESVSVQNLRKFPWLLPSFEYATTEHLLNNLERCVVAPAEAKVLELQGPKPTASW